MPALLSYPIFKATDDSNFPLSGGKLFTYLPSTSTPTPVYHDAALTTSWTNPVVLDSAGEAVIYFGNPVKGVLTDASGVELWTVDPILAPGADLPTIVSPPGGLIATSGQAQLSLATALPAGRRIRGVTTSILAAFGTSQGLSAFAVGDITAMDRWGTQTTLGVGATTDLANFTRLEEVIIGAVPQPLLITAIGGLFDGSGRLEVRVYTETL